ncbi:deacetylase sirtuin-type domain-containing protein, partial [Haematococcus lacustris]
MQRKPLLPSFDLEGVAQLISAGAVGRIVVMTPGTGLYSQLARYNLPQPEAVFSLSFFRSNPRPFTQLAAELLPGHFTPTPTHYFLALLHRKGLLLRCFTQNIDSLESVAGLPAEAVVAAHGNFDSASCIDCGRPHPIDWVKAQLLAGNISHCSLCGSLVKPDIVFFGEALPQRFHQLRRQDLQR